MFVAKIKRVIVLAILVLLQIVSVHNSFAKDMETIYAARAYRVLNRYERKYGIPKDLLFAIAFQESAKAHNIHKKRIIWPWSVNMSGKTHTFKNKADAVRFVCRQLRLGHRNIDVGLMQINLKYHPKAFKSVSDAFDINKNVHYATLFILSKYDKFKNWDKAVAHYHSGNLKRGMRYHSKVLNIVQNLEEHKSVFQPTKFFKNRYVRRKTKSTI